MRLSRANLSRKLISFILLITFISSVFSFSLCKATLAQESSTREKLDIRAVSNILEILEDDYIEKVDSYSLLRGCITGMKDYLKKRNLKCFDFADPINNKRTVEANLRALEETYEEILSENKGKIKGELLAQEALNGMMDTLQKKFKDPYTFAMTPNEYKILMEQLNSTGFSGIGIIIENDKKNSEPILVVDVVEGGPAKQAGLKPGDRILQVNGFSTKGLSLENVSSRIRGPIDTPVILNIRRNGGVFNLKVTRREIHIDSVSCKMFKDIGYIKITFFGETTEAELDKALSAVNSKGAKAIILDVRNNGGGYITSAVQVCSRFVEGGTLVTTVVNYRKNSKEEYNAFTVNHKTLPLVILVNGFSASASEITAGCIKDHKVGLVVGQTTFGKGSVQTIQQISGGGAIKYTTAHYLTPSGKDINKIGITPDVSIKMNPKFVGTKNDTQINKAISILNNEIGKI